MPIKDLAVYNLFFITRIEIGCSFNTRRNFNGSASAKCVILKGKLFIVNFTICHKWITNSLIEFKNILNF
jgi:hypothetical protein